MMKKGVMTVYFSLVFMLVMSFLLVLLESDRLYILIGNCETSSQS